MVFNNNLLLGAAGQSGAFDTTLIERSAWFDGVADDLSATLALGNPSRWTTSLWVRFLDFGTNAMILSAGPNTTNQFYFYRAASNTIHIASITSNTVTLNKITTQVFRDNQWYHFLLDFEDPSMDFYVNGELVTSFTTNTENAGGTQWMKNVVHSVGIRKFDSSGRAKIYVAQFCTIDNKSIQNGDLTVASFLDAYTFGVNGSQYVPKADADIAALATAAGGNSFCLTTAIGDGTDASGNGNNFTPTSMSDAANGSADTPSNIWCVWNRLQTSSLVTLQNGNLDGGISNGGQLYSAAGTMGVASGKWYYEAVVTYNFNSFPLFGVVDLSQITTGTNTSFYSSTGSGDTFGTITHGTNSTVYLSDNTTTSDGVSYNGSTDVIMVAFDADAGKVWFGKNGVWNNSTDPTTDTGGHTFSVVSGNGYRPYIYLNADTANTWTSNFGQNPFAYTPPENFLPLNTANLPTSNYQGIDYFNPILYTGNGSTNAITGVGFQPDLVWIKNRTGSTSHSLYDAVRGVQKQLESDNASAETTETTGLTAFGSDGFTVGSLAQVNTNTNNFVGWSWLAGGAGSSNTDGSITTTVLSADAGHFSIGTYTGNATAGATIGHGLGGTPELILYKKRNGTANWIVYNEAAGAGNSDYLMLDQDGAKGFAGAINWANSTVPTATVATLGSDGNNNATAGTYVFYAFRSVPGVCKIGSYTGNGSADGPYISLGFTPSWVMVKRIDSTSDWHIIDVKREPFNVMDSLLFADLSLYESSDAAYNRDLLSDGFKIRASLPYVNASGGSFLFIAMADIAGGGDLPPIYGR